MTPAFRVTRRAYAESVAQLLDGEGGRRAGGRWHRAGMPVAYFGSSRALCLLELLVHLDIHPADDDAERVAAELEIPDELMSDDLVRRITAGELDGFDPAWRRQDSTSCLRIGIQWFSEGRHWGLQVPSAVIPQEWNLVINCTHPAVRELVAQCGFAAEPIAFDPRIVEIVSRGGVERRRSGSTV